MGKVYTVINQKGGVGKSTTALALKSGLKSRGFKVLTIDLDPQGNTSYSMGVERASVTSMEVLTGSNRAEEAIHKTETGDLIPSSISLAGATASVLSGSDKALAMALEPIKGNYDYIIIDTPPALGILTINAMTASDEVIIPTQADIFSLQGIGGLFMTLHSIKNKNNPYLKVAGILLTRNSGRANLRKEVEALIKETARDLKTKVFDTSIRECVAIQEAQAYKYDLFTYAPKSNAVADYDSFITELLGE